MFWELLFLSIGVILYVYAFRGTITQRRGLSDDGRIFRRIILVFFIIIHLLTIYYSFYRYGETETYSQKISEKDLYYQKCGKVTKKIEGYTKDNESTKYEEQMVIYFDNGMIERLDVSRSTYDRYSIGEGICFAEETEWYKWFNLLRGIGWILTVIGVIVCLAYASEAEFD